MHCRVIDKPIIKGKNTQQSIIIKIKSIFQRWAPIRSYTQSHNIGNSRFYFICCCFPMKTKNGLKWKENDKKQEKAVVVVSV